MRISFEETPSAKMVYVYCNKKDKSKKTNITIRTVAGLYSESKSVKALKIKRVIRNRLEYSMDMLLVALRSSIGDEVEVVMDDEDNILVLFESNLERLDKENVWEDVLYCLIDIESERHELRGIELIV